MIIKEDIKITQEQLVQRTGLSLSTVKRILKKLNENKYIKRIGGTRGYRQILKDN